jgi:hypothetical protein
MKNYLADSCNVFIVDGEKSKSKEDFLKKILIENGFEMSDILAFNDFRKNILGVQYTFDLEKDNVEYSSYGFEDYNVLEIVLSCIKTRFNQNIATFLVFDEYLKDKEKRKIFKFLDEEKISFKSISYNNQSNKLLNDGEYTLSINKLPHDSIDIVGDIHGLYDDFVLMIESLGYTVENGIIKHSQNRKILFLGDVVDRGQKSIEMLKLVYNSVTYGGHFAIIGNHENKILQFKKHYDKFGKVNASSFASSETVLELLKLDHREMMKYIAFIEKLPAYYTIGDIALVHANIDWFQPNKVVKSNLMYGNGKVRETDHRYQKLYDKGINKYTLIRGHYIQEDMFENVFSLEMDQSYAGHLAMLPLDKFIVERKNKTNIKSFEKNVIKRKTYFDYEEHFKKFELYRSLEGLYKDNLLHKEYNQNHSLTLYKSTPKINVFEAEKENNNILKANGIIMDFSGNIVSHTMCHLKNYHDDENKSYYNSKNYIVREKVFGEIMNVSLNPFSSDLMYSSTNYINDKKLLNYFELLKKYCYDFILDLCANRKLTLSFCCMQNKLYLINAKKNTINGYDLKESQLDTIVNEINHKELLRPNWKESTVENIYQEIVENEDQYIGYIFRNIDDEKYNFYLNTFATDLFRFISMLSNFNKQSIFNNKDFYKSKIEQKFHGIIDYISQNKTIDSIQYLDDDKKYNLISSFLESKS